VSEPTIAITKAVSAMEGFRNDRHTAKLTPATKAVRFGEREFARLVVLDKLRKKFESCALLGGRIGIASRKAAHFLQEVLMLLFAFDDPDIHLLNYEK
jgi:hypothetical protein